MTTRMKIVAATAVAVACSIAGSARAASVHSFGAAGFSSGVADHVTIVAPWEWGFDPDTLDGLYVIATNPATNANQVWANETLDGLTAGWTALPSVGSGYTALSVTTSVDYPPVALNGGPIKWCPDPLSGSPWATFGNNAGVSAWMSDSILGRTVATAEHGQPYPTIAYKDNANSSGATVVRMINGAWTVAGYANISSGSIGSVDVALDPTATDPSTGYEYPLVVYNDASNNIVVKKLIRFYFFGSYIYTWVTVGQNSIGTGYNPRIAVSPNGTPWVVWEDLNAIPHALYCSGTGTSCTWSSGGDLNLNLGPSDSAECDRILIQEENNLNYPIVDCVVSRNGGTRQILLRAQVGFGWGDYLSGGYVGLTSGTVTGVDMHYSRFWNSLYVAYADANAGGKLTVRRVDLN